MERLYFWSLLAGGRKEKIRKRELGKDEGTDCWETEEKRTLLDRKKTSGVFWCCPGSNPVEAGQLSLAKQPAHCMFHLGIVASFLEAFKTPARALCYHGQALHTTENMLCLFKCSFNRLRSLWTALNSSGSVYPENRCNGSKGSALPQHRAGHQQQKEREKPTG